MTPYYDDGRGIVIYCGDCRDILPHLPKVDLVLTDPPYGIDYQSARRTDWQRKEKITGDDSYPLWIFNHIPTVALLTFCRWDNLYEIPRPKSLIAWDKGRHSMGDLKHEYGRQWEGIAFYPGSAHEFNKRPADVIHEGCVPPSALVHPNEKPVRLMTKLISAHKASSVGDWFGGSGATMLAAKFLGLSGWMIEIEERYCEIAAQRLSQEVLAL